MKTQIITFELNEDNEALCQLKYIHEDGETFVDYNTLTIEELKQQFEEDELRSALEYLDNEDTIKIISQLYAYTVHQMSGNYSYLVFASDEEYEAIEYISSCVDRDMMEEIPLGLEEEEREAAEQNFYSYYAITKGDI